jgi:RNA polymerase sigma-70 factor (ECF subfamily)
MSDKGQGTTAGDATSKAQGPAEVSGAPAGDAALVEALRRGDEEAFTRLVDQHHESLRRIARLYVSSPAIADEVVQDTWLAVIQGLWAFEGRSSLKTWILRILINRSKTRALREGRMVSFSQVEMEDAGTPALTRDASQEDAAGAASGFRPGARRVVADRRSGAGDRIASIHDPGLSPEARLLTEEARVQVRAAIEALEGNQRIVITMRDLEGCSSEEVRNVLGLSETNQRVILHRARAKVRAMLAARHRGE